MLEPVFFTLGLVNNLALFAIFLLRARRLDLIQRYGWVYFLLVIPAVYAIVLAWQEDKPAEYTIFLAIYLAFLTIEALYDWILKVPFRASMDWRLIVPYVALYISSSYGFVVMAWRQSPSGGAIMLAVTVAQLIANAVTHPRR